MKDTATERVIAAHRASGRFFEAAGIRSFALDYGSGPAVVCLHGVPTSSFLYRKVLRALQERGLRGISFDFPGLGLAERPEDFDYSFSGLTAFCAAAVDALGLDKFHLAVHESLSLEHQLVLEYFYLRGYNQVEAAQVLHP